MFLELFFTNENIVSENFRSCHVCLFFECSFFDYFFFLSIQTLFHVVDKSTGRSLKTSFLAESFFFLHVINSFEDDDHIVIDIISYKDNEILNKFDLSNLRNKEPAGSPEIPSVRRYVIPLINFEMVKNDENLVRLSYTDAEARKLSDLEIILTPDILMESGKLSSYEIVRDLKIFQIASINQTSPIYLSPIILGFENPSINRNFAHKKYRFVYGGACFEPYEHSNSVSFYMYFMIKNQYQ